MASVLGPVLEQLSGPGSLFETVPDTDRGVLTYRNRLLNLRHLVEIGAGHGDLEYVAQGDERLTFSDTFDQALRLAAALTERVGISPGDRVAILGGNSPGWVVAFWALVVVQAIVVPLNPWETDRQLDAKRMDTGAKAVLSDRARADLALAAGFTAQQVVVWGGRLGAGSLEELVAAYEPTSLHAVPAAHEDSVAILFGTSGTTGRPKSTATSHRNVLSNMMTSGLFTAATRLVSGSGVAEGTQEAALMAIPLFHVTACLMQLVPYVATGRRLVFMPPGRFDPDVAGEIVERERVTSLGGVPTVVATMLAAGVHERYDLSSVQQVSYGGAPAAPALAARVAAAFPQARSRMANGYGLTETSGLCTLNAGPDYLERPGSVGIAPPVVDIAIRSHDGDLIAAGEPGEIWVAGPNVITGYWKSPEENTNAFSGTWFRTGDIGFLDDDGFLHLTDRAKDVIISGGRNVWSLEVESVLEEHPAVIEAGVFGVPHGDMGEAVSAVVVIAATGDVTGAGLEAHCRERLAGYQIPKTWELRTDPLPRTSTGKVLKGWLRKGAAVGPAVGDAGDAPF